MALTGRHYWLALGLGCAVVAAAFLPPKERTLGLSLAPLPWDDGDVASFPDPVGRLRSHYEDLQAVATMYREREIALRERATRKAPEDGLSVQVYGASDLPATSRTLQRVARILWARVPRRDPRMTFRLVAAITANDTAIGGTPVTQAWRRPLFPPDSGADVCVMVLPIPRYRDDRDSAGVEQDIRLRLSQGLGPCALYAGFGQPGPLVRRWLEGWAYEPAQVVDWALGGNTMARQAEEIYFWRGDTTRSLLYRLAGYLPSAYLGGPTVASCTAGTSSACDRVWLVPEETYQTRARRVSLDGVFFGALWPGMAQPLAVRGPSLLSDLIRERGAERFAAFWSSPKPVADAFREAFGEPLGTWARRSLTRDLGVTETGVTVRPAEVGAALALALLLLGASAYGATRRSAG
jgi:hypothetical protein